MKTFKNIKAVILDKDGVIVDFHKLWMRVIGYRAQLIASNTTASWEWFNKVRNACIRAMGIDEEDESLDPNAPCSMPADVVKIALITATHVVVSELDPTFSWAKAKDAVEDAMIKTKEEIDCIALSEPIKGSLERIKALEKMGLTLAVFSSDSLCNIENTLEKFKIKKSFKAIYGDKIKNAELYQQLCDKLGISPKETLLVSDSPGDISAAKACGANAVGVLSGVSTAKDFKKADLVLKSLADLSDKYFSNSSEKKSKPLIKKAQIVIKKVKSAAKKTKIIINKVKTVAKKTKPIKKGKVVKSKKKTLARR